MKDSDNILILGAPASRKVLLKAGILDYKPAPGSTKQKCSVCNKHMWIGPRQQSVIDTGDERVFKKCIPCALKNGDVTPSNIATLGGQSGKATFISNN